MGTYLPLFPLGLVVYPGEQVRLHIFEERYKELIHSCLTERLTFGIPAVIDQQLAKVATEVRVISMDKRYANGEMDIQTEGIRRFEIERFDKLSPGHLYPGGEGRWLDDVLDHTPEMAAAVRENLQRLHQALGITKSFEDDASQALSYRIGHHIGMSLKEEYELLTLPQESERLRYILRHLERVIPVVMETERLKAKAKLNGHYKNVFPPDF
ncbi:MAG: peptidase [Bacteroidetes bacterium]|nr:MAG: peptidase [Bacteroidota bacterium]